METPPPALSQLLTETQQITLTRGREALKEREKKNDSELIEGVQ